LAGPEKNINVLYTFISEMPTLAVQKFSMPAETPAYVIGLDFGTDSVRALLVEARHGTEIATSVFYYPRWKDGLFSNPSSARFRQHPLDHIEGLECSIKECLLQAGPEVTKRVVAISVDTTGSSPLPVDRTGMPLALIPGFEDNPNAMMVLWKDHTALGEAAEINEHATKFKTNYLQYVGGIYSAEWFWAKWLHILRNDPAIREHSYSWVEHCDWIPFLLTGGKNVHELKRGVCSAGHKALWSDAWDGLPPQDFFTSLDPLLSGSVQRLFLKTYTADQRAGTLSAAWAKRLGLNTDTIVGVGAMDAHMGAVGGQIEPYDLSKVMGTSTCDILVAPEDAMKNIFVKGICGQVTGSVIPGMVGMEAGQSAFGDAFAWFEKLISWPLQFIEKELRPTDVLQKLTEAAEKIPFDENNVQAIEWLNGRRTPDADQSMTGAFAGLNLATDAPAMFRALVEATCFGAKAIVDRFQSEGVPVRSLIGLGGVAKKSPYVCQMLVDIIGMPLRIPRSEQTCALGAAMFASVVAGVQPDVETAMKEMGQGFEKTYRPAKERSSYYEPRYARYRSLGTLLQNLY
jgi:L-ribulokinase